MMTFSKVTLLCIPLRKMDSYVIMVIFKEILVCPFMFSSSSLLSFLLRNACINVVLHVNSMCLP